MQLENQVVSLELAQKMKELGFEQESLFYHDVDNFVITKKINKNPEEGWISAYTVAELGEMLPAELTAEQISNSPEIGGAYLEINKNKDYFVVCYQQCGERGCLDDKYFECKNEADARAKMLIYLKENNLI